MIKLPYILEYTMFEKIDLGVAEALLAEYNDFMGFNKTQINNDPQLVCTFIEKESTNEEIEDFNRKRTEHNRQVAHDHFHQLFGHNDIAKSTLLGLKIDYDTVQKVLLDERSNKIPITESKFNQIAPTIRAAASVLLLAERVVSDLLKLYATAKDKEKCVLAIEFAKEGFDLLLDGVAKGNLEIPEYYKIKKDIAKFKTVEAYINFCEKLFFVNRDY